MGGNPGLVVKGTFRYVQSPEKEAARYYPFFSGLFLPQNRLFSVFSSTNTIFATNNCENDPSNLQCWN